MPINSVHPDYKEYKEAAEFCEVFMDGEWAVKACGEKLLPSLSGQDATKYKNYKDRAIVFSVVPRTVSALVAVAFRKEPKFFLPETLKYLEDDCTGTGVPLTSFAMQLLQKLLVTGRAGILVDKPKDGGQPFLVLYDGDDIRNWSTETGQEFVVLENTSLVRNPEDKFDLEEKEGYLELTIENGSYVANVWEQDSEQGNFYIVDTQQPLRFGKPLASIPFVPVSTYGADFEITQPPILGLAQLSHKSYLISADRMNAIHLIAVPTPWISSSVDKDEFGVLNLGPDACLLLPENSKAAFLEFTGQGLQSVEKAEKDVLEMMGALGARLLMGQNASSEKATGVRSREELSNSILTSVLTAMEVALDNALRIVADWESAPVDETYCFFNKELVNTAYDANMVNALVAAYQNNSIDLETLFHNLSEGGFLSPDANIESFSKNLEDRAKETRESVSEGLDNSSNTNDTPDSNDSNNEDDNATV